MDTTYEKTEEGFLREIQTHEIETIYSRVELEQEKADLLRFIAGNEARVVEIDTLLAKADELGV